MTHTNTKNILRTTLNAIRRNIPTHTKQAWDEAIGTYVLSWCEKHSIHTLGIYWPIQCESDLLKFYGQLIANNIQLALPIVTKPNAPLQFAQWLPTMALTKDNHGVPIPAGIHTYLTPQALLIPCLGFNPQKFRLGYGGGFYDRTLANLPCPISIGIAYSDLCKTFDVEEHDIPMDIIITEQGLI